MFTAEPVACLKVISRYWIYVSDNSYNTALDARYLSPITAVCLKLSFHDVVFIPVSPSSLQFYDYACMPPVDCDRLVNDLADHVTLCWGVFVAGYNAVDTMM